jgi:hypothetical protein
MIVRDRIIVMVLTVGMTATVRADMTPVCSVGTAARSSVSVHTYSPTNPAHVDFLSLGSIQSAEDLGIQPVTCLPGVQSDPDASAETQPAMVFTNDQGSFGLCLYALLGLGLCRSVPLVKKLSLGYIPDWYHHGGPAQIGHSHVIGPDLGWSAVLCLVQPDCTRRDLLPRYYWGAIASLLRKPLFTCTVLASRGPPSMS